MNPPIRIESLAASPTAHVVPLHAAQDPALVGGKAARLGQLAAHHPVPPGFVVTVDALRHALAEAGVAGPSEPEVLRRLPLPPALQSAIAAALEALPPGAVAVRSSAIAEDGATSSYAGLFESVLGVCGLPAVLDAVRQVWASACSQRLRAYDHARSDGASMAVLVQCMVEATAAGVAFSADPVTGARDTALVSAVPGLGEALVSGTQSAEEWRVVGSQAQRQRDRGVLSESEVERIAALVREIARREGCPQDIEWARDGDTLVLLQARPLTALPDEVRWDVPWGGWIRNFRLGEWIGDPVTPAFESWLLTDIEAGMHAHFEAKFGWPMTRPAHRVVNGWYFYGGLNVFGPRWYHKLQLLRLPWCLLKMLLDFRACAALVPPLARFGFPSSVREWREQLLPAYRDAVAAAQQRVESAPLHELPALIDGLAARAGRNFASVVGVAGFAAKCELPLAVFWSKHLAALEGSWLSLVRSGETVAPAAHDLASLDWYLPTLGELGAIGQAAKPPSDQTRARIVAEREDLLARAHAALPSARLRRRLDRLVHEARTAHVVREEQSRAMGLAWPVMRRALARIGAGLVERGVLAAPEQVFFCERAEIRAAIDGADTPLAARAQERRSLWTRQRRLAVPLVLGTLPPMYESLFANIDRMLALPTAGDGQLRGLPGSPGHAVGVVRVLLHPEEIDRLQPGEVLVAPLTTPAWTPAFARAAAVVTDTGSVASHASIVAREYGIPAVVATGTGTTRLRDGQRVSVDGAKALVTVLDP